MIARASSGSSSCINSVEPLMSANSAVTVLRSPSSFSGSGASLTRTVGVSNFFAAAAAGPPSAVPHSPQKRLPAGLSALHFGQRFASGAPQSPQNFLPGGFSALQLEQRIRLSQKAARSSYIIQRRGGTSTLHENDRSTSHRRVRQ